MDQFVVRHVRGSEKGEGPSGVGKKANQSGKPSYEAHASLPSQVPQRQRSVGIW